VDVRGAFDAGEIYGREDQLREFVLRCADLLRYADLLRMPGPGALGRRSRLAKEISATSLLRGERFPSQWGWVPGPRARKEIAHNEGDVGGIRPSE